MTKNTAFFELEQEWKSLQPSQKTELLSFMDELYQWLDKKLQNLPQPCISCGECCHFSKHGHRLYVSRAEMHFFKDQTENWNQKIDQDICPMLQNNQCTARNGRFIGCRSYFSGHDSESRSKAEFLYETAISRVKKKITSLGLKWHYEDVMNYFNR